MKKKILLGAAVVLLSATALISNYALAGETSTCTDPNVVALSIVIDKDCW